MIREKAVALLKERITEPVLIKHSLAVGAIMSGMAEYINNQQVETTTEGRLSIEEWTNTGILHDLDFQITKNDPSKHGLMCQSWLEGKLSPESLHAIKAHNNEHTGTKPESRMDNALIAAYSLSGLVIATALVYPSKKLEDVKLSSVSKRFKAKDFARACRRELILYCERVGIEQEKFFEIALVSLQKIHKDLEL